MNIELEEGEEKELFINGAQVFVRRSDLGPTERITIDVRTPGYSVGRCGQYVGLSFYPRETDGTY